MKISRNWLSEYVDFSEIDNDTYLDHINTRIAEIENSYFVSKPVEDAIIVEIKEVLPHPNSEKLRIAKVDDGKAIHSIVSGASNLYRGMYTACVLPGGKVRKPNLPSEEENLVLVQAKEVSEILSNGVLCSESELGISSDHSGIIDINEALLGRKLFSGLKLSECIEPADFIIDIDNKSLTHRPDLWSHLGFAREIAAIYKKNIKQDYDKQVNYDLPVPEELLDLKPNHFINKISATDVCSRFSILEVSGLKNVPSPYWLKKRLFSIDNNSKSLLVDISNFVLNDVGQPNHAFDSRFLAGKTLYARYAKEGESFIALDDVKRDFTINDVVISDEEKALDLAGVIGGRDFSVVNDTTDIVLVCSTLDPTCIRKACKRHQIRTDSSSRYEKSLSPIQTTLAMLSYIRTLKRVGQTPKILGFSDAPESKLPDRSFVSYNFEEIQNRLQGALTNEEEALDILSRLQFRIRDSKAEVPYFRATKDISISADLIEEVGRSIGYARVPELAPLVQTNGNVKNSLLVAESEISKLLAGIGFNEVYNYTFSSESRLNEFGYSSTDIIELENSVDQTLSSLRTTLIPGIVKNCLDNLRFFDDFSIFEIGRAYHKTESVVNDTHPPHERRLLTCAIVSSARTPKIKHTLSEELFSHKGVSEFYSLTTVTRKILKLLNTREVSFAPCKIENNENFSPVDFIKVKKWMHPYRSAYMLVGNLVCGHISELRPSYIKQKNTKITLLELDISALIANQLTEKKFKQLPKFPSSFFEISLVADKNELYSDIHSKILNNFSSRELLSKVEPISLYEGSSIPENKKSLSLKFVFQNNESTINTESLELLRQEVLDSVNKAGYQIRS